MRRKRVSRSLLAIAAVGALSSALAVGAQASGDGTILICHGTASDTNPYVVIGVDEHALAGHFDGTAPGHGENNHEDLLLPAGGTVEDCTDGGGGGGEE